MNFALLLACCSKDIDAAARSADLIREFGPYPGVDCILWSAQDTDVTAVKEHLDRAGFDKVIIASPHDKDERGWPISPNHLFRRAAQMMSTLKYDAWFFFEADCLPMHSNWLRDLTAEYQIFKQPFMGCVNPTVLPEEILKRDPSLRDQKHLVGTAIYPKEVARYSSRALLADKTPWDVNSQDEVVPFAHHTDQICHQWRSGGFHSLTQIPAGTAVHHGCKDDTLYRLLKGLPVIKPKVVTKRRVAESLSETMDRLENFVVMGIPREEVIAAFNKRFT